MLRIPTQAFPTRRGPMAKYLNRQCNFLAFGHLSEVLLGLLEPENILIVHGKIYEHLGDGEQNECEGEKERYISLNQSPSSHFKRTDCVEIIRISLKVTRHDY